MDSASFELGFLSSSEAEEIEKIMDGLEKTTEQPTATEEPTQPPSTRFPSVNQEERDQIMKTTR